MDMTDRIFATYTPTTMPGSYHTAVHYERTDSTGNVIQHSIIEAEPEKLNDLSAEDKAIGVLEEAFRKDDGPSRFGIIKANVRFAKPHDDPNAPYENLVEGEDLSQNLARMQLYSDGFNRAGFAYRGDHQNSNTFASALLRAGELPPATGVAHDPTGAAGELLEFFAPGLNEPLRAPIGQNLNDRSVAPTNGSAFGDRFGNWSPAPAGGFDDPGSPLLRALEKHRNSVASDGPASVAAADESPPALPVRHLVGQIVDDPRASAFDTGAPKVPFSPPMHGPQQSQGAPPPYANEYLQYLNQLNGNYSPAPMFNPSDPRPLFAPENYSTPSGNNSIEKWIASLTGADPENPTPFAMPAMFNPYLGR
jgi:hypothetical protein